MISNLKKVLGRMNDEERKVFVTGVTKGIRNSGVRIDQRSNEYGNLGESVLSVGADIISEAITMITVISRVYRDAIDDDEFLNLYLYGVINLTIILLYEEGILCKSDIALISSIFSCADVEIIERILLSDIKETELKIDTEALKKHVSLAYALLDEIDKENAR